MLWPLSIQGDTQEQRDGNWASSTGRVSGDRQDAAGAGGEVSLCLGSPSNNRTPAKVVALKAVCRLVVTFVMTCCFGLKH